MALTITIEELKSPDRAPYDLLLLADPSLPMIEAYLATSKVFLARKDQEIIGCYAIARITATTMEIKNIAVRPNHQRRGIGNTLLQHAIAYAVSQGSTSLVIGTGNSSLGQLYLYQKAGFRICEIRKDFFKQHYAETIVENGIECRDMIVLSMEL